ILYMTITKKKLIIIVVFFLILFYYANTNVIFAAVTFIETFNNIDYKDAVNSTAEWDTQTSSAHLIDGKWVHADNTSSPRLYETIPDVSSNFYSQMTDDKNGQPIIVTQGAGGGGSDTCFFFTKWTVGAGAAICGTGKQDCWTNLEGDTKGGKNNELCLPTGASLSVGQYTVLTFDNGNPVIVARPNISSSYRLYYSQWSASSGWTNLDGVTSGFELISSSDKNISSTGWQYKIDSNNEPVIYWVEYSGSIPNMNANAYFTRGVSGVWKKADRTTSGKDLIIDYSPATSLGTVSSYFEYDNSGNIFFTFSSASSGAKGFKYNGSNYLDYSGNTLTLPITTIGNLTAITSNATGNAIPRLSSTNELFMAYSYDADVYIGKWVSNSWKYVNGSTSGFEQLFHGNEFLLIDYNLDSNDRPLVSMKYRYSDVATEIEFTRWNGTAWVKSDGVTSGYEEMSNLTSGEKLTWTQSYCYDENNYPVFIYTDYVSEAWLPTYFSRYTGSDIKGGDGYSNDQDILVNTGEGISSITRTAIYCNHDTNEIYVVMEPSSGGVRFTKLNNDIYSATSGVLQSFTIAQNYAVGSNITTATLNAVDAKPAGTSITYYLSADGGAHWCAATNGVPVDFTTCDGDVSGEDLRWKASMTTSSSYSSPTIEYLWINSNGLTNQDTSGQVNITGTIDPLLTLTLPSSTCTLGTFSESNMKTCNYEIQVSTNGVSGYIGYVKSDGLLRTSVSNIDNVSGSVTAGTEAYGISTTESDSVNITRINDANSDLEQNVTDCIFMNDNTVSADASALSENDQSFTSANGPVNADSTYLCHVAAIAGQTPAGFYSQKVTITVVSNF
ncbi:hypothetical protein JW977_03765, partial [Candidatus Falkowbacteria bacterium]|nr:hypothetical protein [Candidatus Falkowbacteria bacterium]